MVERLEHIMGMPVILKVVDGPEPEARAAIQAALDRLEAIDQRYSTYKPDSEISRINAGLPPERWSQEMRHILDLCEQTAEQTNGYFNILHDGIRDPSGLVKGWAIQQAADILRSRGFTNIYVEAGGDIQTDGHNAAGQPWRIGIRNPFNRHEIIKTLQLSGQGVATSGTAIRGAHIYNPHQPAGAGEEATPEIISLTVIGPDVYEADRFATAAFAMGRAGIQFIDQRPGLEGYLVDRHGQATLTRNFERYTV